MKMKTVHSITLIQIQAKKYLVTKTATPSKIGTIIFRQKLWSSLDF
jgi:hypothetical protein